MFGAIAGGNASALAGGAMSRLFVGGQKAAYGGIQGDVLATDNNAVGMGDAGSKSAIQGANVPNPEDAVPSFFFQAEDGIRNLTVTGVQTCALPISREEFGRCLRRGHAKCVERGNHACKSHPPGQDK